MNSRLVGKKAYITDKESIYYREWGIILDFDGEYYAIAIAGGNNTAPIFARNEFKVRRK